MTTQRKDRRGPAPGACVAGFTLIELLVVMGVVSALMGVLMPALGRARGAAQRIQCASGVRQLQIANDLYASDHDELFMPGAAAIQTTNLHRWHGVRRQAGERFVPRGAPMTAYLDGETVSRRMRACPTFAGVLDDLKARGKGFEGGSGGYGYNNAFVGTQRRKISAGVWEVRTDRIGSRRSRFLSPVRTVAFADCALAADELIEYSFIEPARWPNLPPWRPDPSVHFRHAGMANVAWLDGHVSSEMMSHSESSGMFPVKAESVGIGWFGDVRDNTLYDYR